MNQEAQFHQPPPQLSRKLLWITLGIPPALTLLVTFFIPLFRLPANDMVGLLIMTMLMILLGIIPGLSFHFHDAIKIRYRGPSLNFLVFSYIFGQIIVCAVLAVGSCVLISFHYKI